MSRTRYDILSIGKSIDHHGGTFHVSQNLAATPEDVAQYRHYESAEVEAAVNGIQFGGKISADAFESSLLGSLRHDIESSEHANPLVVVGINQNRILDYQIINGAPFPNASDTSKMSRMEITQAEMQASDKIRGFSVVMDKQTGMNLGTAVQDMYRNISPEAQQQWAAADDTFQANGRIGPLPPLGHPDNKTIDQMPHRPDAVRQAPAAQPLRSPGLG